MFDDFSYYYTIETYNTQSVLKDLYVDDYQSLKKIREINENLQEIKIKNRTKVFVININYHY